jgi:hypothetical protein
LPPIFWDSFNHEPVSMIPKWDFPFGGSIVNNPAIARTGSRCCQISGGGSLGPSKNLGTGLQVIQYPKLIQGVALNWDAIASAQFALTFGIVAPGAQTPNVIIQVNTDGSISAYKGAGDTGQTLLGTSVSKPFAFNPDPTKPLWNYLEAKVLVSRTVGSVEVRFAPPTGPMDVILSLAGVNTAAFGGAFQYTNQVQFDGPGALNQHAYFADYYCSDWSDGSSYLGGIRIYADLPFDNGSPLQFVPSMGQNWQNVNSVPPNPPATGFNSSGTVGQIDQYQHNVGATPIGSQIMALQHVMQMQTDGGARSVTSVAGGVVNPNAVFLSNGFAMQTYPYVNNTKTGNAWKLLDFPFQFGPMVVS